MKNIIAVTNKTGVMTIFNNFNSAVNSVNEDSKNPMKKELIKTAIEIGCSAYDKEWKSFDKIILNKDFLVNYLKHLSKKDYEKIIERVGTPIVNNIEEVKEETVEETVEVVKEETVEETVEVVKEETVEEVKEKVKERKLNVFNSIFIPNKDRIINCYDKNGKKFPKEIKYTYFNLYPESENDERFRVLVYHKNDKKKTNPFPTNIFICKNGDLIIDKEIIDMKNSKYVIAGSFLNIEKIHLNIKTLFGCGFINPNGYNFIYKNEVNNNPENIVCKNTKQTKTWKYVGIKK